MLATIVNNKFVLKYHQLSDLINFCFSQQLLVCEQIMPKYVQCVLITENKKLMDFPELFMSGQLMFYLLLIM